MKSEHRALGWIAIGALALRLVLMLARGDYIVFDEGYYLLLARSLRAGHGFTLNGLPHVALSPLQPILVAVLSALGLPALWASRLLAAACGALLVFPVAALARRLAPESPRAPLVAALLVASSPALMSFVPFFPGRSWNLYFGSEPLFLLLAFGAVAAATRADEGHPAWWPAAGAMAGAAYLTRAEGIVLGPVLLATLAMRAVARRGKRGAWRGDSASGQDRARGARAARNGGPGASWRGLAAATLTALVVAAPYLWYLHPTLGRWALTGRVQAAQTGGAPASPALANARTGGDVLQAFVWQGHPGAFLRSLYALDPSGTRMASQYWGVHRTPAPPAADSGAAATASTAVAPATALPEAPARGTLAIWWDGLGTVIPWWLGVLALAGLVMSRGAGFWWVFPLAVCATLPSALTYVEPRSLLTLAPLAAAYAALAVEWIAGGVPRRWRPAAGWVLPALTALALVTPALRELVVSWPQTTPLQRVSTARRAVGEYLGAHLPPGESVMSWHPAIAIWARRPWRVLPDAPFDRIARYATRERAGAVVFSRFEPSPLSRPPRPFTVLLPDSTGAFGAGPGSMVRIQPVTETPLLFVGRMTTAAERAP